MPSETHQIGYDIDTECVAAWVHVLVGRSEEEESGDGTLANFGVDDVEALDVWSAVQGDFVERSSRVKERPLPVRSGHNGGYRGAGSR